MFSDPPFWDTEVIPTFATYYLDAYAAWKRGDTREVDPAWRIAFRADPERLNCTQLLYLGINAHVNNDLAFMIQEMGAALHLPGPQARRRRARLPDPAGRLPRDPARAVPGAVLRDGPARRRRRHLRLAAARLGQRPAAPGRPHRQGPRPDRPARSASTPRTRPTRSSTGTELAAGPNGGWSPSSTGRPLLLPRSGRRADVDRRSATASAVRGAQLLEDQSGPRRQASLRGLPLAGGGLAPRPDRSRVLGLVPAACPAACQSAKRLIQVAARPGWSYPSVRSQPAERAGGHSASAIRVDELPRGSQRLAQASPCAWRRWSCRRQSSPSACKRQASPSRSPRLVNGQTGLLCGGRAWSRRSLESRWSQRHASGSS